MSGRTPRVFLTPTQPTHPSTHLGYVRSNDGTEFKIRLSKSPSGQFVLHCCSDLQALLGGQYDTLVRRSKQQTTAHEFAEDLVEVLDGVSRESAARTRVAQHHGPGDLRPTPPPAERQLPPFRFYSQVVQDLSLVGWENISSVNESLTDLSIRCIEGTRSHTVRVRLSHDYPHEPPVVDVDIPEPFSLVWNHRDCSLASIVDQFLHHIGKYRELWDTLDELDGGAWVLEPSTKTRAALHRRIVISKYCSLMLQVSVASPKSPCDCQFFGADGTVIPLRNKFNTNLNKWDVNKSIKENLEAVLEVELPTPSKVEKEAYNMECGICYAYQLSVDHATVSSRPVKKKSRSQAKQFDLPDQMCDNPKCGKPFHMRCLLEWLRSLPSTRHSFDTLFGYCPYCSQAISVRSSSGY